MANQYLVNQGMLNQVIAANDLCLSRARAAQSGVQADSEIVKAGIRATSGTQAAAGLVDWSADFQAIIMALESLQEKAQALQKGTVNTDMEASQASLTTGGSLLTPFQAAAPAPYSL